MDRARRLLWTALPKVALSRSTGALARVRLPRRLRAAAYAAFARRYGANLDEMAGTPQDYPTFAAFFQRPLRPGARPIAAAPLVWLADGTVVSAGPLPGPRVAQVKGFDYSLRELVASPRLAADLDGGSHATVYLAPGDYHRVHAPFDAELQSCQRVPGGLFPVHAGALRSIPRLFARNERVVLGCRLADGRPAALVLVAALNVADTTICCAPGQRMRRGDEVGRFGLGSTVVAVVGPGEPSFAAAAPGRRVRVGEAAAAAGQG